MVQKIIGLGVPDKGNGDPLRTAFSKVNDNFAELYNSVSAVVVVGATAPINPSVGDLWWNSESGRMYVYYGTAWVDASPVDGAGISSTNQLVNGAYTTSLGANGVLTLPDGSIINGSTIRGVAGTGELNYTGITIGPNSNDAEKTWVWVDHANAYISTNNSANTWTFNNNGGLTFPQGTFLGYSDPGGFIIDGAVDKDIAIYTYSGADAHGWTFGTDGSLTFPDSTVQSTAWTNSIAYSNVTGTPTIPTSFDRIVNSTKTVSLGTDGSLTFPSNSSILTNETALKIATHSTTTYTFNQAYWEALNGNATRMLTITGNAQYFSCTVTANQDGTYTVVDLTGNSFEPGDWFKVPGNELGGVTPANDIQINIATVDGEGVILTTTITGTAVGKQWQFGTDGSLTLPIGVSIDSSVGSLYPKIIADSGKLFSVQGQGNSGSAAMAWTVDPDAAGQYAAVSVSRAGGDNLAKVILQAQSDSGDAATAKTWRFDETGTLKLPLGNSVISNLVVVGDLSTGSQIQVGSGVEADTGIIISNSVTNSLGEGGPALESGSLVNVNGSSAYMALKTVNSLGEGGGPTLTGEEMVEVSSSGVRIGVRVTNDPGDGSPPLVAFQGWTFDNGVLSLPLGTVITETASSPGLYRTKYSGTFVLDPTWFAANTGNIVNSDQLTDSGVIQNYDEVSGAFSFQYFGYFVPPTSANYTFKAHADETFVFWIGAKALSGYTYANKDMYGNYNGTFPEQQTQSFTIALTAGEFYPIRIQWANSGGIGELDVFTWANDIGQADTADFTGRVFRENTGTAKIAVNDNRSIILSTDNATDNNWTFAPNGTLTFPDATVQTTAWTGTNVLVNGTYTVTLSTTGQLNLPSAANAESSNARIQSAASIDILSNLSKWTFGTDGELALPTNGYTEAVIKELDATALVLFAQKAGANVKILAGATSAAGAKQWLFNGTNGNLTLPASGDVVDSTSVSQLAKRVEGSWTVTAGTNNYSFEVPINGAYQLWVRGNIDNGIISYIATVQVTNTNVGVLGSQRAWNYTDSGSPILITSMPSQIIGTEGTISTTTGSGTTNNVFVFGISNTSGSNQTVRWGYIKI